MTNLFGGGDDDDEWIGMINFCALLVFLLIIASQQPLGYRNTVITIITKTTSLQAQKHFFLLLLLRINGAVLNGRVEVDYEFGSVKIMRNVLTVQTGAFSIRMIGLIFLWRIFYV